MSRCYPFPPPGYVRDESMIESIKGTKEEVKREKKNRKHKKDKKRKERENENEAERSKKHRHKRRRRDESDKASKKVDDGRGLINNDAELLDKSCLTVELEHQTSSQTSCDSTLHSNERPEQSQSLLLDGRHYDSETSIRILLHDKGHKFPEADEVMTTDKDQKQCSSLDRLDASQAAPSESVAPRVCQEKKRDPVFGSSGEVKTKLSKEKRIVPLKDVKSREKGRQTSMQLGKEKPFSSHQETIDDSKLCSKCPPSTAVRFLNLIENWSPAPDRVESKLTDSEDQEWWLLVEFGAKRHHQVIVNQTTSIGSSSMLWPTARFLPEAGLHALPFTVPF
ncbi:unnamed protein product [Thlaspi arvense]|uniref:Uncharacterized protein n=1 Tax=Thlaspi arvense TaxID=13288 RepID=A0AAU9RXY2_THLAR|nr:unnamed protein product [Thlaspi arvense]